jgi:hypothetical protein
MHCQDCGRYFKGPTCFNLHKKKTPSGNSTCTPCCKCKNCGQTVNKRVVDHTCGNVYCNIARLLKIIIHLNTSVTCYLWITTIDRRNRLTSFSILNVVMNVLCALL